MIPVRRNSRRDAAFVLARWLMTKDFPSAMLPDSPDRAFVQDLVYTAIRRLRPLRLVLGELVKKWPKGEMEALLYVGAAQILYMPEVPDFAAVNETVEAAKACDNPNIARVVNGVLRNLLRRKDELLALVESSPVEVRESLPTELVRRWTARFGVEAAERLARWHNEPAETYLAYSDGWFEKLPRGVRVDQAKGYAEGAFIVQDPGTRLAVELLDPHPGENILDACAAPGGKTAQIAWRGACVTACEVNPKRRRRLEANLARLGLDGKVSVASEIAPGQTAEGPRPFDKVLVDAPCSNTGVLRRRPDARWNWSEEKLRMLVRLQAQILDQAARLVASGGCLVYSTCSNEPEENTDQIAAFLARNPGFELVESRESIPCETGYDGAFASLLRRRPE